MTLRYKDLEVFNYNSINLYVSSILHIFKLNSTNLYISSVFRSD